MILFLIFRKKANIFNEFFAKQCTVAPNSSKPPSAFIRKADKYLSTVTFYKNETKRAICNLDPNKAHGHDMLSIHILKNCDDSLCGQLGLIFQSCFENGSFPSEWKKVNVVPTFKRNGKQIVKNYHPLYLRPICGKIFERLIYNKLFHFF